MDAKGALVCSTVETSDYWQGDEAKWQRTYRDGLELFVDEPALDLSTGTYAVQLSVPVSSGGRKAGALTFHPQVPQEAGAGDRPLVSATTGRAQPADRDSCRSPPIGERKPDHA